MLGRNKRPGRRTWRTFVQDAPTGGGGSVAGGFGIAEETRKYRFVGESFDTDYYSLKYKIILLYHKVIKRAYNGYDV